MTDLEFTALVRQYQGLVYTVCYQLVEDEHTAQDLAQETFLSAWRAAGRCPPGYEKQWLVRIAANKAKDYLRSGYNRKVGRPGDDALALASAPDSQQPEQAALATLGEAALRQAVLALREPYRTPCMLCWLQEYTIAEAAARCQRPPGTVSAQLARARRLLAGQFGPGAG